MLFGLLGLVQPGEAQQVVRKLATADRMLGEGKDVADVCRELQVSEQTYYRSAVSCGTYLT